MKNRTYAICSGSGGVGKSTLAVALAMGAAAAGEQAILLDASGISRSCDLLLGLQSIVSLDLTDVLCGEASIEYALLNVPQQQRLRFCCTSLWGEMSLTEAVAGILALRSMCKVLVIDMQTGHLALEHGLLCAGDTRVLLTRPDDISLRATERMLTLCTGDLAETVLLLNLVRQDLVKMELQYSKEVAEQILGRSFLGSIQEDDTMVAHLGQKHRHLLLTGVAGSQLERAVQILLNS